MKYVIRPHDDRVCLMHSGMAGHRHPLGKVELMHWRPKGPKNGVRLYQYEDGSLTPLGYKHYGIKHPREWYSRHAMEERNERELRKKADEYSKKAQEEYRAKQTPQVKSTTPTVSATAKKVMPKAGPNSANPMYGMTKAYNIQTNNGSPQNVSNTKGPQLVAANGSQKQTTSSVPTEGWQEVQRKANQEAYEAAVQREAEKKAQQTAAQQQSQSSTSAPTAQEQAQASRAAAEANSRNANKANTQPLLTFSSKYDTSSKPKVSEAPAGFFILPRTTNKAERASK